MTTWTELLASDRPIVADGAMGTVLMANGLEFGDPPELWNLEHPEIIRRVQRGYLDAGAQILLTNTFGGNRLRLELHGREDRVDQLNRTAAVLARVEANAADHPVIVAGDIGPSGQIMAAIGGTLTPEIAREVFAEQARAFAAAGVDVMWIETMSDVSETVAAIQGAKDAAPDLPVIATMSFDTRGHTMMGVSPERAAEALLEAGAAAVGANCGNGPEELLPVIDEDARRVPGCGARREGQRRHAPAGRDGGRLRDDPGDDGRVRPPVPGRRRERHRRVLRKHAAAPAGDGRGPADGLTPRAPASKRS